MQSAPKRRSSYESRARPSAAGRRRPALEPRPRPVQPFRIAGTIGAPRARGLQRLPVSSVRPTQLRQQCAAVQCLKASASVLSAVA